jgi:hypothetical protein
MVFLGMGFADHSIGPRLPRMKIRDKPDRFYASGVVSSHRFMQTIGFRPHVVPINLPTSNDCCIVTSSASATNLRSSHSLQTLIQTGQLLDCDRTVHERI